MANDADVQDIKNSVRDIQKKETDTLDTIVKMETSLSDVSENSKHISETLEKSGDIYDILDKIREQATGIRDFLGTNNRHISSVGSGTTITNASGNAQNFGGFSDTFNKIYEEIKNFHEQVVGLLDIEKTATKGGSVDEIAQKILDYEHGKEKAQQTLDKEHTSRQYIKDERKRRREKQKADEKINSKTGNKVRDAGLKLVGDLVQGFAKGMTADQAVSTISGGLKGMGAVGMITGGILDTLKMFFDMYAKVDQEASNYARTVGGSRVQKSGMILSSNRIAKDTKALYGLNQEDIIKSATETAEAFGRNVSHLSNESLRISALLKKMGVNAQVLGDFDTYGKSIQETDKYFTTLYQNVSKRGLSFKNVSKTVADNLKTAQSYNFANGLKGLEAMAEKSTQFKFNMQQAFTFADRVSTFEGAIQTAANLSVLGGSFGNFANPMQMMYEGLNDVEALQERMIKTFGNFARYDTEKKEIVIDPTTKMRIKEAAKSMGVDPSEMISMTMAQERYRMVESQLANKSQFKNKETIDFIKNLSEIRDGIAYITLNGQEKRVSDLTESDAESIRKEQQAYEDKQAATMGDIFVHTKGIGEKLDDLLKYITTRLGVLVAKIAGVGFSEKSERWAWKAATEEQKQELIKKYGSKQAAKAAVGMGQESELVDAILTHGNKVNADAAREYFNQKGFFSSYFFGEQPIGFGDEKKAIKNGNFDAEINRIAQGKGNAINNASNNQIIKNIEPSAINSQSNNVKISNINENTLQPMNVNPINTVGAEKVEVTPFDVSVKIDGKIDLTSGDKSKTLDLSKLSQTDIDKLTAMIYKQVYTEISKKFEHGYNKENYPFRGA